jgi:isopenicillin N synthase-like dioxygenase
MTSGECPVLDLRARDSQFQQAMALACERQGYFAVRGHGLSRELLSTAAEQTLEFFARPIQDKLQVVANAKCAGYVPPLPADDPGLVCFPREAYNVLLEEMAGVWPRDPASFSEVLSRYFRAMSGLCMDLLHVMSAMPRGLRLDGGGALEERFLGACSLLRATLYAETPSESSSLLRCEPHTDLGVLSIIDSSFESDGLQVQLDDGTWLDVLPPSDTLLVVLGDEMKRWMNGVWRSPVHRVGNPSAGMAKPRLSLIYFHNPDSVKGDVEKYLASSSVAVHARNR